MARWAEVTQAVNDRMAATGITQRELAEKSGVSLATLRKIQHGSEQSRNRSTLANISRALGFPENHLWQVATGDLAAPEPGAGDIRQELADLQRRVQVIESRLDGGQ